MVEKIYKTFYNKKTKNYLNITLNSNVVTMTRLRGFHVAIMLFTLFKIDW